MQYDIAYIYLNLLDLNNESFEIPEVTFNSVITLPSSDFQKIIRDMSNISENIEIKRPGTGISPMRYWELLGTVARRSIPKGSPIDG